MISELTFISALEQGNSISNNDIPLRMSQVWSIRKKVLGKLTKWSDCGISYQYPEPINKILAPLSCHWRQKVEVK